jgi:putative hemolysin
MIKKSGRLIFYLICIIILLVVVFYLFIISHNSQKKDSNISNLVSNPASIHCLQQNGTLEIRTGSDGQYGVCIKDTKECEEWKFYRGECSL